MKYMNPHVVLLVGLLVGYALNGLFVGLSVCQSYWWEITLPGSYPSTFFLFIAYTYHVIFLKNLFLSFHKMPLTELKQRPSGGLSPIHHQCTVSLLNVDHRIDIKAWDF